MLRTALRNVSAHKARLLMTVLAVLLGVAFVAGTLVFTSTVSEAYTRSAQKGLDHVDVQLRPGEKADRSRTGSAPSLPQQLLDRAAALPGAARATGVATGFAALAGKDGKLVGRGWSTVGANYYGADDPRYPMRTGTAPSGEGGIAMDAETAARTGYRVGDTVRISVDGPVREERVTGIFTTDDGDVAAGGTLVLFDTPTAQRLFARPGGFDSIEIGAAPGTSQQQLKERAERILPAGATAVTGRKLADDQAAAVRSRMSALRTGILTFAGISLFVGVFLIANTFTMLVAQRTKELALLRAIGAGRRQVTRSVLLEAAAVGAVAAVLGVGAGIGIGAGLRSLLSHIGGAVPDGPIVVTPASVAVPLLVGVVVTVLAAWLPARRAAKIPPVAAMGSVHAVPTIRSLVVRNSVGSVLAAAGAALVVAGTGMSDHDAAKVALGTGAFVLLIGVFVLTPLLSRAAIGAAAPLLRPFGVTGKLARQNAVRDPRRTAATASALTVGLTLITGLTVVGSGVAAAIDKSVTDSLKADYVVAMATPTPLSSEVERTLDGLDEVTASTPLRDATVRVGGKDAYVTGVNGRTIGELANLSFDAGSWAGLSGNRALVDRGTADRKGWEVGSAIDVRYQDGARGTLTVSGVYQDNEVIQGIVLDTATIDPHLERIADQQVLLTTEGGPSATTRDALERALGNNPAVQVRDKKAIAADNAGVIALMLDILYAMLGMAVLIAVLGVVNTLAMSVFERYREIGMLRALGLDRRGVKRMVRLESLVISVFGGVLGIGLGVFLGWAVGELIAGMGLSTYSLVLPWSRMGGFLALAALVGVVAALWPARRAAALDMPAAVRSD